MLPVCTPTLIMTYGILSPTLGAVAGSLAIIFLASSTCGPVTLYLSTSWASPCTPWAYSASSKGQHATAHAAA